MKLPGLLNRATTVVPHVPFWLLNLNNGSSGQCTAFVIIRDVVRWTMHTPLLLLGGAAAAAGQLPHMVRPAGMPLAPKPGLLMGLAAAAAVLGSFFSTMMACKQDKQQTT